MKIIKQGKIPSNDLKAACGFCKCVFSFDKRKEGKFESDQREGDFWRVKCPCCKTECFVYPK